MSLNLQIKGQNEISNKERKDIDEFIEYAINVHKGNSAQINRLVMDSVTALTISETRSKELASQGFFKKLWNGFSGKNQKIRADIDRNIAKSQYGAQQMIQKLAEQNLLAFDTITSVNNKLNSMMSEVDDEINKIYNTLVTYFKQTRSNLIQLETRIGKLERNVDLLHWNSTIEYQMYDNVEYNNLPEYEKIVCIANDFYHLTKGKWTTSDLMLLKATLSEIGLQNKVKVSLMQFLKYLANKPSLFNKLFDEINYSGLSDIEPYHAPLIKGVEKLKKLQNEEKYVVDTVVTQIENVDVDIKVLDIQVSIVDKYLLNKAFVQIDTELELFDMVVELLSNISMMENLKSTDEVIGGVKHEVVEELGLIKDVGFKKKKFSKNKKSFDVVFISRVRGNKYSAAMDIMRIAEISKPEAMRIVEKRQTVIKKSVSKTKAEKIKKQLAAINIQVEIQ